MDDAFHIDDNLPYLGYKSYSFVCNGWDIIDCNLGIDSISDLFSSVVVSTCSGGFIEFLQLTALSSNNAVTVESEGTDALDLRQKQPISFEQSFPKTYMHTLKHQKQYEHYIFVPVLVEIFGGNCIRFMDELSLTATGAYILLFIGVGSVLCF